MYDLDLISGWINFRSPGVGDPFVESAVFVSTKGVTLAYSHMPVSS